MRRRYVRLRRHASGVVGSNFDISDTCNLFCEGCLYFEGGDRAAHGALAGDDAWAAAFAAERARGVNFPYLAGAEPALQPERLRLAAAAFGRGVVFTNGTVPIDSRLPFAIHVSLWGDAADTPALRGGASFERAFRLFSQDERVHFVYTVNRRNLRSAAAVAQRCADEGARLTFSLFSPTTEYNRKLAADAANDDAYFRTSTAGDNLSLDAAALAEVRLVLDDIARRFPATVLFRPAYSRWVTDPDGVFRIDPATGFATDCGTMNSQRHRHVRADLSTSRSKCASPNIECRTCRAYAMTTGTAVSRFRRFSATREGFRDWLDIAEQWSLLFLRDFPRDP